MKKKTVMKMGMQKKAKGGSIDGLNQHKALAMGKAVSGKKRGGKIK